ncbi:MAG: succinate dehydrogenase, hydrophobic membrane anchor protein [Thiobacillus sp.]|nr:succinate dehydrogenase, hydrophobic membrane anchor protein [Thiobacillus sp.]
MKRALGSHTGTGSWLMQRATALALAVLLPLLAIRLLAALPADYAGWRAAFAPTWVRVAWLLAALSLALHAWVGMRDLLMDYVQPMAARLALYLVVIGTLAGSVIWLMASLWSAT